MTKLSSKKDVNALILLFTVTYMISYITRINYGAVISEMEVQTKISRSLLSMAVTGSFITYGAGQIVSGIFGDKVSPKKLISIGLIMTALMNALIPITRNAYQMLVIWCVNGFAQSFMWPPLVRMMAGLLSDDDYKKATLRTNWGGSFGTIAVYLISPILISLFSWRAVFVFASVLAVLMLIFWNKFAIDVEIAPSSVRETAPRGNMRVLFTPLVLIIMLAILLQGAVRDSITTWMPTYIMETYNLSSSISILTGVILPIFNIFALNIAASLYRKKFSNPISCACVLFGAASLFALVLFVFSGKNAIISALSMALLSGSVHGVNLILVCMLPAFFQKAGIVSTASGVLNSATYIGSALSTYGIALLSEKLGWSFTIGTWLSIAVVGTLICLICIKPWQKRKF